MNMKKICFISSSGGHFTELYRLKEIAKKYDSFLIVEKTPNFETNLTEKKYFIKEINRRGILFLFRFISLFIKEFVIFLKEKPDIIISTGALASYPIIRIAKIFKKKIIYIESYARVNDLSLTGKKVYNLADLFIVQWPELVAKYPNSKYFGDVFGGNNL